MANFCLLFPKSPFLLSFPRRELGPPDVGGESAVPCVLPRWRRHLREGAAGSVACLLLPALNVTSTDPKAKRGPGLAGAAEQHESRPGRCSLVLLLALRKARLSLNVCSEVLNVSPIACYNLNFNVCYADKQGVFCFDGNRFFF